MKLAHEDCTGKMAAAWSHGGWRERCGLLAGAYCASFIGGLLLGHAGGWGTASLLMRRMERESFRSAVLEETLMAETAAAKRTQIRPEYAEAKYQEILKRNALLDRELNALEALRKRRGVDDKSLEAGVRASVSPLMPVVLMNMERQRSFLEKALGRGFPRYKLLFNLHYAISEYLTYRNTAGNVIPRDMKRIADGASGDCKDHSALLASLALAGGLRVKYVSWNGDEDGTGHAYLFVRVFAKPSEEDLKALRVHFLRAIVRTRAFSNNQDEPTLRKFDDGTYMACDPTNYLVPGVILKKYLGPKDDIEMFDFRPQEYGIASCGR